jgi:signal transduction histidine kinase
VARHEIPVNTTLEEEPDLPLVTKETLYRIAQEALYNTVKHAKTHEPTSAFSVSPLLRSEIRE